VTSRPADELLTIARPLACDAQENPTTYMAVAQGAMHDIEANDSSAEELFG
jgi:hypothetical protein